MRVRLVADGRVEDEVVVERSAPPALRYELKVTQILAHESGDDDWNEPAPYAEWTMGRIELGREWRQRFAYHGELYTPGMRARGVADGQLVSLGENELLLSGPMLPRNESFPVWIKIWEDDSPLRPTVWTARVDAEVARVCFGPRQALSGLRTFTRYERRVSNGMDLELIIRHTCRLPIDVGPGR